MATPVAFVSHGAPTLALDLERGADLTRWAATLGRPRALLVVSAHWLDTPPAIGTRQPRELLHDFSGFPEPLYHLRYDAPAAADVAERVEALVPDVRRDDARPWDHGVWVPLRHMFPAADVPVVQLSLPFRWSPRQLFELGQRLATLRDRGVLLLASGGAVHNLGRLHWSGDTEPPAWATDFEAWLRERLAARAFDDVVAFRDKAPSPELAHPTDEHFLPLLVALGAAGDRDEPVQFPVTGFEYGSLSRLCVQFG
ncbi:MAG TPA: class III extradiol ring-cleavage dioxygenase [Planctomycetota bacterium]|nr:class III extradiol ring-cleavage dioxygenase [Planctomycetota bacterium]